MVKLNILVIDDEYEKFHTLLKENFSLITTERKLDYDFDFVFCETMEKGKNFIEQSNTFDLIILDLLFKDKSGEDKSFELLKFIKENYSHIPVLMFSAAANISDLQKAGFEEDYRPDGFVNKNDSINKSPRDY